MSLSAHLRGRRPGPTGLPLGSLAALLLALALLAGCAAQAVPQLYHCPMHPDYVSDKPGDCPICGMRLVPLKAAAPKRPPATDTNPEHQHGGVEPPPGAAQALPSAHADEARAEMAGIRTAEATRDVLVSTIRAVGSVVPDETRVRHVTTKVGGYVEKLYVNAIGQFVKAGQPLFELYSPELLASQQEYLRARQSAGEFAKSPLPEIRRGGEDLASSARQRLELFDVPPGFLDELDRTGKARRTVVFRAPYGGYVSEKNVVEGHKVDPGADLVTITDLSRVWVAAQVYEAEAGAAAVNREATVTLPYDAATTRRGRVTLVYPTVDADSRTIKIRLEFANPGLTLKPGMFVNVALEASRVVGVVVPDSAVIDSGARQVVFVESAPGHFEQREVRVGPRADGRAILRSGVRAGERVAVSASFLLDSESRLRGAAAAPGDAPGTAGPHEHRH